MRAALANGLMFNLSWFLIVYSHNNLVAPLVALAHVSLHLAWLGRGQRELQYILLVSLSGLAVDQLLFACGLFVVQGQPALAPLWLSCLWPVLATTGMHAFASLQSRPALAALFGAIGGYVSYTVGTGLSTVDFGLPQAPVLIGLLWAALFPTLLLLAAQSQRPRALADHA